jgi:hypothetical protein
VVQTERGTKATALTGLIIWPFCQNIKIARAEITSLGTGGKTRFAGLEGDRKMSIANFTASC